MDAPIGWQTTQPPDASGRRPCHDEIFSKETDRSAPTEFVEADASRSVHPSQDQLDGAVSIQALDLAKTESRFEELADAGDTVLACEVVVGGSGEVSHGGSFPGRSDGGGSR